MAPTNGISVRKKGGKLPSRDVVVVVKGTCPLVWWRTCSFFTFGELFCDGSVDGRNSCGCMCWNEMFWWYQFGIWVVVTMLGSNFSQVALFHEKTWVPFSKVSYHPAGEVSFLMAAVVVYGGPAQQVQVTLSKSTSRTSNLPVLARLHISSRSPLMSLL
jgi:hypothetical protein